MEKKITIKDIAREAGVSIATVSYVLNNRQDKRISDETKKKVLQVVNMFNYTCSFSARQLSTGKTNIIALYIHCADFALSYADKYQFVSLLIEALAKRGYSLRIMHYSKAEQLFNVDAIVCYDTPTEFFRAVGNSNYVPLLSYNNIINDTLFYQINTDYEKARRLAEQQFGDEPFGVASLPIGNLERYKEICRVFPNVQFVDNFDSASEIAKEYRNKPLLLLDPALYDYLLPTCTKVCGYCPFAEKIELLVEKMIGVINRADVDNFDIKC